MTFTIDSSISGRINPALSVTVDTSLDRVVTTAMLKSDTRIVQRPSDLTNDEITISLNGIRIFTGFIDNYRIFSDGQRGVTCDISLRSVCAPTGESMICSERAVSSEDDALFQNAPLRQIFANTMQWEKIDHPYIFRGNSSQQKVRAFQWSYGEVFGDSIERLAAERGIVFTDLPEGGFQFIDHTAFINERSNAIRESQCRHLELNTDYNQRYQTYTGLSREDPVAGTRKVDPVVEFFEEQLGGGASRVVEVILEPARIERFETLIEDTVFQRTTTFPRKKNWCRDYTSRELSVAELAQAVNYEINRRRVAGTKLVAVIPDLVPFRKGERAEFDFDSAEFEGVPRGGWTINSVRWQQTGQVQPGNLTTVECVPTQQFSVPLIDGTYDGLIGDE